jgi:hypothetical protein
MRGEIYIWYILPRIFRWRVAQPPTTTDVGNPQGLNLIFEPVTYGLPSRWMVQPIEITLGRFRYSVYYI